MPEITPFSVNVRVCFDGYDLSKVDERKVFSAKKALELELSNYLAANNFILNKLAIAYDEKKLHKIAVELFAELEETELRSRISLDRIQTVVLKEVQGLLRDNFNENQRRSCIRIYPYNEMPKPGKADGKTNGVSESEDDDYVKKASAKYVPIAPFYTFDHLVINKDTLDNIEIALAVLEHSALVFEQWGLKRIEPFPRAVLNFYGPPGTGKTLAAHAIAHKLGKKLLVVGCPEIQSKYHGEGPKNVKAVFYAAEKSGAILFFDEADSLLSKRLEEVNTGSEDEINNMRNAMLTCLEIHKGIVIFASNFVKRYDYAFETRVQSILFPLPDAEALEKIWTKHFLTTIPVSGNVDLHKIAEKTLGFCGRDVKNAVIKACFTAVHRGSRYLTEADILDACDKIVSGREEIKKADYSRVDIVREEAVQSSLTEIVNANVKEWRERYLSGIPVSDDLNLHDLAELSYAFSDREIKSAVMLACFLAEKTDCKRVTRQDILNGLYRVQSNKASQVNNAQAGDMTSQSDSNDPVLDTLQQMIDRHLEVDDDTKIKR